MGTKHPPPPIPKGKKSLAKHTPPLNKTIVNTPQEREREREREFCESPLSVASHAIVPPPPPPPRKEAEFSHSRSGVTDTQRHVHACQHVSKALTGLGVINGSPRRVEECAQPPPISIHVAHATPVTPDSRAIEQRRSLVECGPPARGNRV